MKNETNEARAYFLLKKFDARKFGLTTTTPKAEGNAIHFACMTAMIREARIEAYEECALAMDKTGDMQSGDFLRRLNKERNGRRIRQGF